jgi:hypothetical protein
MATIRLVDAEKTGGLLAAALQGFSRPIAGAATKAVRLAGETTKTEGRAAIANAGFGPKWQNALRVKFYPDKGTSIDSAALVYHKIHYAGVFDQPTKVSGSPLLWVPIAGAAKSMRGARTPAQMAAKGVKLFSLAGTNPPVLGAKIKGSARSAPRNVSLSKLKRGTSGKRGVEQTVPLFVGLSSINQKKRFDIAGIAEKQRLSLSDYYSAAVSVEAE